MHILVGDIGGTKTSLAIYAPGSDVHTLLATATYPSAAYPSLEIMAHMFMRQRGLSVTSAVFGVAGPVVAGETKITQLPWQMSEAGLAASLGLRCARLLNDLEAIAHAIPVLGPTDTHDLTMIESGPHGPIGVVAPGTGLGEAFLLWRGAGYDAFPSEGGHCDFAPASAVECDLLKHLLRDFEGHVSYERVCSGRGLPNIYAFMRAMGKAETPAVSREILAADDPTPVIVGYALRADGPCPLCNATLDMFASILAAQAGNLALTIMATGGIYLGGGIPPRILPVLQRPAFLQVFQNKGRLSGLMARVPVRVITNSGAALLGAARVGLMQSDAC